VPLCFRAMRLHVVRLFWVHRDSSFTDNIHLSYFTPFFQTELLIHFILHHVRWKNAKSVPPNQINLKIKPIWNGASGNYNKYMTRLQQRSARCLTFVSGTEMNIVFEWDFTSSGRLQLDCCPLRYDTTVWKMVTNVSEQPEAPIFRSPPLLPPILRQ
jgi:hypothetical protein